MNAMPRPSLAERYPGVRTDLDCPECGAPMVLKHPPGFAKPFYGCSTYLATKCPGFHGASPDGRPMGTPADTATRDARWRAHQKFDAMWQGMGMLREDAYRWLAIQMALPKQDAHIGRFSFLECEKLIAIVENTLARGRPLD